MSEQCPHIVGMSWCEQCAEERIAELEVELAKLEYRLKHTHKLCETCLMTALDTTGLNICDGCGQKIWEGE